MGGTSDTQTQQQSSTQPWDKAQGMLKSILGQLQPQIDNSGLSSTATGAINTLEGNANAGNPYTGQISGLATNLLNGGGATNQAGNVDANYQRYVAQTNPLASNTNYDPMQTPGMQGVLDTIRNDVGNSVNGQFAAAGRDMSGMNTQTLARGIAQGEAAPLLAQYNQNVQNQQGAAGNLYNAGNSTAGIQTGMTQQGLNNQLQGVTTSGDALTAQNYTPNQILSLENLKQSLPAQTLGLLAQIGIPIAGLGSQSQGSSTGSSTMSGAQQFGMITQGIGNLIPKGPMTFNF